MRLAFGGKRRRAIAVFALMVISTAVVFYVTRPREEIFTRLRHALQTYQGDALEQELVEILQEFGNANTRGKEEIFEQIWVMLKEIHSTTHDDAIERAVARINHEADGHYGEMLEYVVESLQKAALAYKHQTYDR